MATTPSQTSTTKKSFLDNVDLRRMYPDKYGNPVMVHCPEHGDTGKPNLAVYPQNVYCFHPSCDYKDGILGYIKKVMGKRSLAEAAHFARKLAGDSPVEVRSAETAPLEPLNDQVALEYQKNLLLSEPQMRWLNSKYGLTPATIKEANIGYTNKFPYAFTIPVYDIKGKLMTIRYRVDPLMMTDTSTKYWGMTGRNNTMLYIPPMTLAEEGDTLWEKLDESPYIFLTEGEMDALVLTQMGEPAVSTTNGAKAFQSPREDMLSMLKEFYVLITYDQDRAGQEGAQRVGATLLREGLRFAIVQWPSRYGKDPSELLAGGRGRAWFKTNSKIVQIGA